MKERVFHRYERDADGRILIDVTATRTEDLYNDFDRSAPYIRRDLDQDLVDYLIGCASEVASQPFAIRLTLTHPPDESRLARIRGSVANYFVYLAAGERRRMREMMRRSAILLCVGAAILVAAVWLGRWIEPNRTVVGDVFAEGLTVAAWVALWEALATFLIGWFPYRKRRRLYHRLAEAEVGVRAEPASPPPQVATPPGPR